MTDDNICNTIQMKQSKIKKLCNKDDKIPDVMQLKQSGIKKLWNKDERIPYTTNRKESGNKDGSKGSKICNTIQMKHSSYARGEDEDHYDKAVKKAVHKM